MMSNYLIKALNYCEEALEKPNENQTEWEINCRKIGNILQSMGWFDEAVLWHSRLLESQQNLGEIYQDLAQLYTRLEKWEAAISAYEKLLKFNPENDQSYLNLSKIYLNLGDKEKEIECLFQMLKIKPEKIKPEGYYKLGKEFQNLEKNDRAINCYLNSIEKEPHLLEAYYNLAKIYTLQGEGEKAINIYEKLLEKDEKQPLALYNLGQLWWDNNNYQQAITYLIKAAILKPKLAESYFQIAINLNQKEELELVIEFCRALIGAKIVYPWTYIQLANALIKKEDWENASLCYQQAGKLRGWDDCVNKNYQFTKDYFNYKIDILKTFLEPLSHQPLLRALELGCQEGMSTCWLLDQVLDEPTSKLTCIEPKFADLFKQNLTKTGMDHKVTLLEGYPPVILRQLTVNSFDLINLQDAVRKSTRVQEICEIVWALTKEGGLIIFNDYGWKPPSNYQDQTPKQVIDAFLGTKENDFEILYQGGQLIIKKIS